MNIEIKFKTIWDSFSSDIKDFESMSTSSEENMKSCIHSGNVGDIIYSLPTVRSLGAKHFVINLCKDTGFAGRNIDLKTAKSLAPLLLSQPYISRVTIVSGSVPLEYLDEKIGGIDFNLDKFRLHEPFKHHLSACHAMAFGLYINLYLPWIFINDVQRSDHILINLTPRYIVRSKEFWFDSLAGLKNIVVVGTPEEYAQLAGITADFITCNDFLELTKLIARSHIFIGNPSLAYAIAEGLKVTRIVDIPEEPKNAYPIGKSGYKLPETVEETRTLIESLLVQSQEDLSVFLFKKMADLEIRLKERNKKIQSIYSSWTWKTGRIITTLWKILPLKILRKSLDFVRKVRDETLSYKP